ncbi:MAG: MarR family winged helix-turn-helix transcriptional regulator [bacterium JZ-2024 1]
MSSESARLERSQNPRKIVTPEEPLEDRIADALERIATAIRAVIRKTALPRGLTATQCAVLERVLKAPNSRLTISELASEFRASKASISDTVALLKHKGYLKQAPGVRDRRVIHFTPTEKTRRLAPRLSAHASMIRQALTGIPPADRARLYASLLALIRGLLAFGYLARVRMCLACRFFMEAGGPHPSAPHFCALLNQPLALTDLRIHCPDYQPSDLFRLTHK